MPASDNHPKPYIVSMTSDTNVDAYAVRNDYSKNYPKYFAYARLLTPSRSAAEDLVQQAFLNILDVLKKGQAISEDTLSAYIKRIIRNLSISDFRKDSVQPILRIVDNDNPSAESQYLLSSDKEVVALAIASLSETQRVIVVMYYFDGLKVREIAQELNMSVSTAKTHLQRARQNVEAAVNADKTFPTQN